MALTGILAGANEQRDSNTNYLKMLEQIHASQAASGLDLQRLQQQKAQFQAQMEFQQQQAEQAAQMQQNQLSAQGDQQLSQAMQGQLQSLHQAPQEMMQLAQMQRQGQARNALKDLLAKGGDVGSVDLGKAILPYDTPTGINLIKAGKDEMRQQQLLDRTGGTGVQPERGYRWTKDGNQEAIPGGSADPRVFMQMEAIKAGAKGPAKLTAEQQKIVDASNAGMSTIDRAIKLSGENKGVFGQSRGLAESFPLIGGPSLVSLVGKFDSPTEQAARGAVFQEAATVAHELLGSAQSPSEKASVQSFLPSASDNAQQIGVKLAGLKQIMQTKRDAVLTGSQPSYGDDQAPSQTHNSLPDPRQYNGKIARDTSTGTRWMSNGRDWVRAD